MKKSMNREIEVLSPAGSYECFMAAIAAGADAVYAGGPRFGARAFAKNFTEEELLRAIDYAHIHGRKFYLTINTLFKEAELDELGDYLSPYYQGGLDAVIVQDVGVLKYVKEHFPGMDIHASTQMTITSEDGAAFIQKQGAVRVVPARELSLQEIRRIKDRTGMEVECFVHGALCYSFSGQCLMSSMIGGRSGNRGQCAQPCRLPYQMNRKKGCLLSLKDICTLEIIPDLIEAGIDSFKIEGRMKQPEYVAGVTAMYRKYVDLYQKSGRKDFCVDEKDKECLMDLYNRGGFDTGYFKKHNGKEMLTIERSNHAGVKAGKVISQKGREVIITALTDLMQGDVFEVSDKKDTYTLGKPCAKGRQTMILVPKGVHVRKDEIIFRTHNTSLVEYLKKNVIAKKVVAEIEGCLTLRVGEPARLCVWQEDVYVEQISDMIVQEAANKPLETELVLGKVRKTGNTDFMFRSFEIEMDANCFFSMKELNEMRRNALEQLYTAICDKYHRKMKVLPVRDKNESKQEISSEWNPHLSVLVQTREQLEAVLGYCEVKRIYLESSITGDWQDIISLILKNERCEIFLAFPQIFRDCTKTLFQQKMQDILKIVDGVLLRNYESYSYIQSIGFEKKIILDYNLYTMNTEAKAFWRQLGVSHYTAPVELNRQELEQTGIKDAEIIAYGYLPVMVSAQCLKRTTTGCDQTEELMFMEDRLKNKYPVRNQCRDCFNLIYNPAPVYLLDLVEDMEMLQPLGIRLQFSIEDVDSVLKILDQYHKIYLNGEYVAVLSEGFTRGHFRRGIY